MTKKTRLLFVIPAFVCGAVFIGYDKNPYKYMSRASLLDLPSNTESLGLVLLEAMACGCPVITADCMPHPTEVVETGIKTALSCRAGTWRP